MGFQHGVDANQARTDVGKTPLHGIVVGGMPPAVQYLVAYGASLVRGFPQAYTGTTRYTHSLTHKPKLAEWLNAVSSWSQLRVAAGCRLYKDAAPLLR